MVKQQGQSRREVGGAVFAVIFCLALSFGLWLGARAIPAATQQSKIADKSENQKGTFYCNTKSLNKEEWAHKKKISDKMRDARVEIKEVANGYAFRYRPEGVSLVELADWVSSEARCCPFFDMGIAVERDGGPVWLTLSGSEGVKEFIRMEFKLNAQEAK